MRRLIVAAIIGVICAMLLSNTVEAKSVVFEHSPFFETLGEGDKAAILVVHFGTTHEETRINTLDAINAQVRSAFPDIEVREAYTSRIINKRLGDRGIIKLDPRQAFIRLREEGFTHVLVQPTAIVNGLEMNSLQHDVDSSLGDFKVIRLSTSLLFHEADYEPFIDVLTKDAEPDTAYVWVGHGTYDVSTAQYAMLDHLLISRGHSNVIVGCIEGYPYFDQALQRLRRTGLKRVVLQPLMIVAGEHAKEDIAEEWRELLESEGFEVELRLIGMGELPSIRRLIIDKMTFYSQNRRVGIMEKKAVYEVTGEKMYASGEE